MANASVQQVRGVPRWLVHLIMILIFLLGTALFLFSYLFLKSPESLLTPLTGAVDQGSRPQFMIYGTFGEGQFKKPLDVTVMNERIYVSDSNNHRIQVFDYDGNFIKRFGTQGYGEGELQFPYGIVGDGNGQLYVADLYRGNISIFDRDGNFLKYFDDGGVLDGPGDLVIKDNKLYVTDINKSQVFVFDLDGKKLLEVGESGRSPGQLLAPNGITVDDQGNMYVVDTGNGRVEIFDAQGKLVKAFNGAPQGQPSVMVNPRGIGIRGDKLYVVSNLTHIVYTFSLDGERLDESFGEMGSMDNQFILPNGLFIDDNGRIYITDTANLRVAVWQ